MNDSTLTSGKIKLDWDAFKAEFGDIEIIDKPARVKKSSRDFFWYSPILERQLEDAYGDIVARPASQEQLGECLRIAYAWDMPCVIRGGGTGNYGQAVPLDGGLIIDMTRLDRIVEIGDDHIRVEAGAVIADVNRALHRHGRELPVFPSTQNIATVGGFIGGGSGGIGSFRHGPLAAPGIVPRLKVMSLEESPQLHVFDDADINIVHHAWGMNGVIYEATLQTVPRCDWINVIASFADYPTAFAAGMSIGGDRSLGAKLLSVLDARFAVYFTALGERIPCDRALMNSMVPRERLDRFRDLVESSGGSLDLALDEAETAAAEIPHVFEFSYNHTTLQALKADKSVTYLQVGAPLPLDVENIKTLHELLHDEVLMHHEFSVRDDGLAAWDIPVIRYTTEARLYEIIDIFRQHGCAIADPHQNNVEGGGMKNANFKHLAWKKRLDPKDLLNSGKSLLWPRVKDLPAEQIENLTRADLEPGAIA
ncbi:MAG: FAD-binding oxidoreductase [Gammaproteobacteria bacterium]|nr:FAD-binding oxidoreductase [Gammaproteobacteria bacterium]